jgi:3-hydroxybutyryl-CoA dehydratase
MPIKLSELQIGLNLPEIQKNITQEEINLYAKASHDYNPIHINEEFARKTPAGGTIAHGMLILAYVSQMMTDAFGKNWLTGGRFNIRFKAPARPGDVITIQGKIKNIQDEKELKTVSCDVLCANQKGETVITGEAIVRMKSNENFS